MEFNSKLGLKYQRRRDVNLLAPSHQPSHRFFGTAELLLLQHFASVRALLDDGQLFVCPENSCR